MSQDAGRFLKLADDQRMFLERVGFLSLVERAAASLPGSEQQDVQHGLLALQFLLDHLKAGLACHQKNQQEISQELRAAQRELQDSTRQMEDLRAQVGEIHAEVAAVRAANRDCQPAHCLS